jgi:hypothetical protein
MFMIDHDEENVGTFPAACQQNAVRPPRPGQVIQRRDAHDAPTDDDDPRAAGEDAHGLTFDLGVEPA